GGRVPPADRPVPGGLMTTPALRVVEGLWTWYRHNWRATIVSSLLQPLLMLVAFGVGFGSLIDTSDRALRVTGGVPYLVYLAPALLAVGAVQTAAFESSYPILASLKWRRTYDAITATPITPGQLANGQLTWIALRLASTGAIYLLVITLFGAVRGPGVLAALVFAVLSGMAFSAPLVAFAASRDQEGGVFTALFRFIVLPMVLFSGTFFPISQLPAIVQPLAWISPLWHGTELARGVTLGRWQLMPSLGHLLYLTAMLAVGVRLARWQFRVRLSR
ncbi:MAG TPA: ABC transporter permease, partial [Pseudonocardiaceae bacterium]|nr:ABC transporter permease [Pseudonocardiaceae bacterium]